jgi:hypothetical protein
MADVQSELRERRRRLLRAAVGVPAVFTLPSGAALAAASLTCVDRSAESFLQRQPPLISTSTDGWVRIKLQKYTIKVTGGQKIYNCFQYGNQWYSLPGMDAGNYDPQAVSNMVVWSKKKDGEFFYGLVNYPEGSLIVSQGGTINPVAGASCWCSLNGGGVITPGTNLLGG